MLRRVAPIRRRTFSTALLTLAACRPKPPAIVGPPPLVQSGDVTASSGIVWAKSTGVGKLVVDWSYDPGFAETRTVEGPMFTADRDFTAQVDLVGLAGGRDVFYRAHVVGAGAEVEPAVGRFRTFTQGRRARRIVWSADCAGQGWGVDPSRGGMRTFESMRALDPDLFLHLGDRVYADNPILPTLTASDGGPWTNLTTVAKSKVAETLAEYRGAHAYNFLDASFRRFHAQVPYFSLWDDHEVHDNWWPDRVLTDPRFTERRVPVLAERGRRAWTEYTPLRPGPDGTVARYRQVSFGSGIDLFLLDGRSFRGSNDRSPAPERLAFWGAEQVRWLANAVAQSKATWKILATDMPIGLAIPDILRPEGGIATYDGVANGRPELGGRELEVAELLAAFKRARVTNVVWLAADVHCAHAHRYDPKRARFTDFDPFWEFVAGPLHAGSFYPAGLDETFGPESVFRTNDDADFKQGAGPDTERQYFGVLDFDEDARNLTVSLRSTTGKVLFTKVLEAAS